MFKSRNRPGDETILDQLTMTMQMCLYRLRCIVFVQHEFIYSYKQSRRREDDIAVVNAGLRVLFQPGEPHWTVQDCSLAYGGMSYVTVMASKTRAALLGK